MKNLERKIKNPIKLFEIPWKMFKIARRESINVLDFLRNSYYVARTQWNYMKFYSKRRKVYYFERRLRLVDKNNEPIRGIIKNVKND